MTFRLNVSVKDADAVLEAALGKIDAEVTVRGALRTATDPTDGVLEHLQNTHVVPPFMLDLIAHAADGQLQLGDWAITATEQMAAVIAQAIPAGLLASIRLLGCYTAATQRGVAAMRHLKEVFDVPVFGTSTIIGADSFGPVGLFSTVPLLEVAQTTPAPAPIPEAKIRADFMNIAAPFSAPLNLVLRPERELEARSQAARYPGRWLLRHATQSHPGLQTLMAHGFGAGFRVLPGLLQLPDAELLYPLSGMPGLFHRVTSLFGGRFVRVYPTSHPTGIIFPYDGLIIE